MRSVCLFALVALVCGCASNVEDPDAEGGDGDAVAVDVETSALEPSGVVPGVTLPPGVIEPPSPLPFPLPPGTFVLPPLVTRFLVAPQSSSTCLVGRPPSGAGESSWVDYRIHAPRRVRSLEFFRDDVAIRRVDWPSTAQLESVFEIPQETYSSPSATVRYSIVATDTDGRRGTSEATYHISPRATLSFTGAAVMRGPTSGAGVRVVSIPWIGDNVASMTVGATSNGWGVYGVSASPHLDPWGRRSGVAEVALAFTAAEWSNWLAGGQRLSVYAQTPPISSGCATTTGWIQSTAILVSTAPPTSSGDAGTPPGSSGDGGTPPGTPLWTPSGCTWVCNWADHPDKVIVDFESTVTGCGATPYSTGTQYRMCSLSGAPAGAETSICSGQATPSGWTALRSETRADVCVPTVGSGSNNTQVIRRL